MYRKGKSFGLEIYDEKRGIEFRLNGDRMHCPIENEGCYISFSVFSLATGKIQAFGRLEMEFEADVI